MRDQGNVAKKLSGILFHEKALPIMFVFIGSRVIVKELN
jgi:hypothetical protein